MSGAQGTKRESGIKEGESFNKERMSKVTQMLGYIK